MILSEKTKKRNVRGEPCVNANCDRFKELRITTKEPRSYKTKKNPRPTKKVIHWKRIKGGGKRRKKPKGLA